MGIDREREPLVARFGGGATVQLRERDETLGLPADDRERERKPEPACPNRRFGAPADGDPDRQRLLHRPRVDVEPGDRRAVLAGPGHALARAEEEQQLELLGEEVVVVLEVVAEERERLR